MKIILFLFILNLFSGEFVFENKSDFSKLEKSGIKTTRESAKKYKLELSRKKNISQKELFFDFENKNPIELKDKTGNYTVNYSNYDAISAKNLLGKKHASFAANNSYLSVATNNGRLFDTDHLKESFYISFFLKPGESEENSIVFSKTYFTEGRKIGLECKIINNKIQVQFSNMFRSSNFETTSYSLSSDDRLSIENWTHIVIVVEPNTGKYKLYENAKLKSEFEAITSIHNPTFLPIGFHKNDTSPIIIGKNFFGQLDDFLIAKGEPDIESISVPFDTVEYDDNIKFAFHKKGVSFSKILETKYSNSKLLNLDIIKNIPLGTSLEVYFRFSDLYFDTKDNSITWIHSDKLEEVLEKGFKFLQWKMVLKSNFDGTKTPSLEKIKFTYSDSIPPNKPSGLKLASQTENSACLKWTSNHEENVREGGKYFIHYGVSPDRMVGTLTVDKDGKPITGLTDGQSLDKNYRNLSICIDNDLISVNALNRKDKNLLLLKEGLTYFFKISACNANYNPTSAADQKSKLSDPISVNFKSE